MTPSLGDYGLAAAAFALVWKLMDFLKVIWMQKKGYAGNDDITHAHILGVARDAKERIKRWDDMIGPQGEGPFDCVWKDRDEVLGMVNAITSLTTEVRLLREEIQRDRTSRKNGS